MFLRFVHFHFSIQSKFFSPIILFLFLSTGCIKNTKTMEDMKPYDGPIMEVDSMKTIYSDDAEVKVILTAKKQLALQNGNREFPEGVVVDFYEHGKISSTLTSNF